MVASAREWWKAGFPLTVPGPAPHPESVRMARKVSFERRPLPPQRTFLWWVFC